MSPKQPRTIFDGINENVVNLSEDMNTMHCKVDELLAKIDVIYTALVPVQECSEGEPNAVGDTPENEQIGSGN